MFKNFIYLGTMLTKKVLKNIVTEYLFEFNLLNVRVG